MNKVLRREVKFLLSQTEFYTLKGRLDALLHTDLHNGNLGYCVRSLYFDTLYNKDYFEKEDGVELRRKIRLRCYNPNDDFAMLEIKQKQGAQQLKRSMRVSKEVATKLSKGNYEPLLKIDGKNESFANECYAIMNSQCYLPRVIVEYQRIAYVAKENKIRITLDHNVRGNENDLNLFSPNLILNPVIDLSAVILEVKYNNFLLDYIRKLINPTNKSELSVSKYYIARQCLSKIS